MKKNYLLIALFLFCGFTTHAQFRVLQNGRVQAGLLKDVNEDLGNVTSMQIFGKYGDMRSGSKLSFGDFGQQQNSGWNVFIGEYGSADTDQLWLHGKQGIYLTTKGDGNNVVAYYNPSANTNFVFNTNLRVNGVNITSDTKLKDNINTIQNPLKVLSKLNGVTYTYRLSELQENAKQDDSKFTGQLASDIASVDSKQVGDNSLINSGITDKSSRDKQTQILIDRKQAEEANRKRIGFLAQDIQKVLPELVQTDEKGIMSIDYIGFIPLLVESVKEMQQTIDELKAEIKHLSSDNSPGLRSATSNEGISPLDGAKLYARNGADVGYSLPTSYATANLQIYDITGKMLKNISLDSSMNKVNLPSSEIGLGTFVYVLVVDGQKRDTLKKIVSR